MNVLSKELVLTDINCGKPFTIFYEIDRFIDEVLIGKEYESLLKQSGLYQRKDLKVLDLGCNIGTFSLYIYGHSSRIYSVDLSKNCIELIKLTISHNKLDKIIPIQKAIAGSNRKVCVTSLESTDGGNSIYGGTEELEAITLSTFFKENNIGYIDLLKIDVEGAEKEIFTALDFPEIKDKIGTIIGEVHSGKDLTEVFKNQNYSCIYPHFIARRV